jgi:hypothetical protein
MFEIPLPPVVGWMIALSALLTAAYFFQRRVRTGDDPSVRYTTSNAAGSTSFVSSGTHATAMVLGVAGIGLAIAGALTRTYIAAGVVLLTLHYILEKREDMEAETR